MNKKTVIASLNKIANELDNSGMFNEANEITDVMKRIAQVNMSQFPEYAMKMGVPGALGTMAAQYTIDQAKKINPAQIANNVAKTVMPVANNIVKTVMPVPYMAAQYVGQLAGQQPAQPQAGAASPVGGAMGEGAANGNANRTAFTGVGLTPRQLLQAQQQAKQQQQQQVQQQKQQRGTSAQDWINANSNIVGGDVNKLIANANQAFSMGGMTKNLHNDIMYILNLRTNKGLGAVRKNDANKQPSPTMGLA